MIGWVMHDYGDRRMPHYHAGGARSICGKADIFAAVPGTLQAISAPAKRARCPACNDGYKSARTARVLQKVTDSRRRILETYRSRPRDLVWQAIWYRESVGLDELAALFSSSFPEVDFEDALGTLIVNMRVSLSPGATATEAATLACVMEKEAGGRMPGGPSTTEVLHAS